LTVLANRSAAASNMASHPPAVAAMMRNAASTVHRIKVSLTMEISAGARRPELNV
jgi:hypothetical protein